MSKLLAILLFPICALAQVGVEIPVLYKTPIALTPPTLVLHVVSSLNATNTSGTTPPANGDRVAGWGDQSGNGYHLIQLGGTTKCPLYETGGSPYPQPNSKPYLYFDSVAGIECMTNKAPNFGQTNTFIWVLYDTEPAGSSENMINEAGGQNTQFNVAGSGGVWTYHMFAGTDVNLGRPWSANAWHIVTMQYAGANSTVRVDGVLISGPNNVGSGGCNGITMANFFNSSAGWLGAIAEFFWYSGRAFSDSEKLIKEEALGTTYGITVP